MGAFRFGIRERRGKPYVTISSDLGNVEPLSCKLDVNPPPWLRTGLRAWVSMPVHGHYGGALPRLHVVQLEENVAEKIARLNRTTTARDAYDLVWIIRNRRLFDRELDLDRIRRLAVLKIWVDANGMASATHTWKAAREPQPLDVDRWLRERRRHEFDDENIGLLVTPPPPLDELGQALSREYAFLRTLDSEEQTLAACNGRDRSLALRLLSELPDSQLPRGSCW